MTASTHRVVSCVAALAAAISAAGCGQAAGQPAGGRGRAGAATRPAKSPDRPPYDEMTARHTGRDVLGWAQQKLDGESCRVSPVLAAPGGYEINHHRVTVSYTGTGSVQVSVAHHDSANLADAVKRSYRHSRLTPVRSGREVVISSGRRGERFAWLLVRTDGGARIQAIRHTCWRGKGTLYGHVGRVFEFAGAKLPYRLMYPKDYDARKAYPLVLSVSGSGGVGTDNVRNLEMVILGRFLFTNYFNDKALACFSLVPQIPPGNAVPAPYWPKGPKGRPTPVYHPDWPAVNETGWYTQATLALIQSLLDDEGLNIDPDRVYYSGFSYGGKACWEFLKAGRGTFAAAMAGAGWPVGSAFSDPKGKLLERLKLEVRRYKHVPVFIFAGEKDRMRLGSRAVHDAILAQGGKSTYVEFPNATHVSSAGRGWGNRKHIAWLFKQSRKNNPDPGKDPFPEGAYPDRAGGAPR